MRYAFALLFCPVIAGPAVAAAGVAGAGTTGAGIAGAGVAGAGVVYDFNVREVDQSDMAPAASGFAPSAVVTRYFVAGGKVRVGAAGAKTVYLFKDGTEYVVEDASRSMRVLKHATLSQVIARYADAVRQLQQAAAAAAPEDRAAAERKAADLKRASDRLLESAPRVYAMTVRFESVDGRSCRIWEEREGDEKRLELCVAPAAAVPGGAAILEGMHVLSTFRQGGNWALGVDFGLSDWWPDVVHLGGVPLLIREFKFESLIREATLTAIQPGNPSESLWELPAGYALEEGPEYSCAHPAATPARCALTASPSSALSSENTRVETMVQAPSTRSAR